MIEKAISYLPDDMRNILRQYLEVLRERVER